MTDPGYEFEDVQWHTVSARFERRDTLPPTEMVSNVNLAPYTDGGWVIVRLENGSLELPGGTLEAGEAMLDGLRRELMEEAGAELVSFSLLGAWHCRSSAQLPYKPHIPHPFFYRVVGYGEVRLVAEPTNPEDGEQVAAVEVLPLNVLVERLLARGRKDLANVYRFAAAAKAGQVAK